MAGVADGSIIATIITDHMSTSAHNGGCIAPIGIPPRTKIQLNVASNRIAPTRTARSWRNNRVVRSAADDAMAREMEVGELAVFLVDGQLHRPAGRSARGAADVGNLIFEAIRQNDLRPRFFAADFVADRLAVHLDIAGHR